MNFGKPVLEPISDREFFPENVFDTENFLGEIDLMDSGHNEYLCFASNHLMLTLEALLLHVTSFTTSP
jgi:hypothetical protein